MTKRQIENASGQVDPKGEGPARGKFHQDGERPRPSERLRREGESREEGDGSQSGGQDRGNGSRRGGGQDGKNGSGQGGGQNRKNDSKETGGQNGNSGSERDKTGGQRARQEGRTKKAQAKAEQAESKLEQAKEKLAAQKPEKPPGLGKRAIRSVGGGTWVYAHNKIHQAEHENVGVEAAHKSELLAETGIRQASRQAKRRIRERPSRMVEKWEQRSIRANARLHYHKMAQAHPELYGNPLTRFLQKQKIKREYQKNARKARKAAKNTASLLEKLGRAVFTAVSRHPMVLLVLFLIAAAFLIINSVFATLPVLGSGMMNTVIGTSYTSQDSDLVAVEQAYVTKENGLQSRIDNIERDYPDYDEYRYDLDEIQHNPHELASYLTALYQTYTLPQVQDELQRVFDRQYELTLTETVEVRYRTETHTSTDPETGETTTESEEVPYDYYILNVKLVNRQILSFAPELLNEQQVQLFHACLETSGNKPLVFGGGSPDSTPSEDLSGVHFVEGSRPGNPAVVQIAKSQVGNVGGQPYWSWYGFDSRVAWCACFVSWCYNQAGVGEPRFASCASQGIPWFQSHGQWGGRDYENLAPGDAIFFDWEGDGRADHVGIVIGTDGQRVYTVEGNSGNACKIKSYPLGSGKIYGYGLMNWD